MARQLAVSPTLSEPSRRRELLNRCTDQGWFVYESENPPGHVDDAGRLYETDTYTIRLPYGPDGLEWTLLPADVEGFVIRTALEYGPEGLAAIAFRESHLPAETS